MLYGGMFDKKEKPSPLIPQPYGTHDSLRFVGLASVHWRGE